MTVLEYFLVGLLIANVIMWFVGNARRLREVERKLTLLLVHLELDPTSSADPSSNVISLAADPKQRTAAIKAYRVETGAGLKEAASVIEKIASRSNETST